MSNFPLGFQKQKFSTMWACGAYSFGHLLNIFGISNYVDNNIKACKTIPNPLTIKFWDGGTDEGNILKALKKVKFNAAELNAFDSEKAKKILDQSLKNHKPVILSVDNDRHWLVAVGIYKNKYVLIDSGSDESNTIVFYSWNKLRSRWDTICDDCKGSEVEWCNRCSGYGFCLECFGRGRHILEYCFNCGGTGNCLSCEGYGWEEYCNSCLGTGIRYYGIVANYSSRKSFTNLSFLKTLNKFIDLLSKDRVLQEYWGYYLLDLMKIFNSVKSKSKSISAGYFINHYKNIILKGVRFGAPNSEYDFDYHLKNYSIVADAYGFNLNKSVSDEKLIALTSVFTKSMLEE